MSPVQAPERPTQLGTEPAPLAVRPMGDARSGAARDEAASRPERAMIPGIGEPLPAGERLLWTGQPDRRYLARHVCHTRKTVGYFGVLLAVVVLGALTGGSAQEALTGAVLLCGMAVTVLAFAHVYASLVARTTVYAITERRLVLRIGVAIPAVLNIPLDQIESVDLRRRKDGTGDVIVSLSGDARIAYLLLWPHARPWRYAKPEPALRGIEDAAAVGGLLAEAVQARLAALEAEQAQDDAATDDVTADADDTTMMARGAA